MKTREPTPLYVWVLTIVFVLFLARFAILVSPLEPWLELRSLERQVKKNIAPVELEAWATNLLAQHTGHYKDFEGTTLPAGLRRVTGFGHDVEVHGMGNGEGEVWVFAGRKGSPFLVVGPTSLTNTNFIPWKPGIYFIGIENGVRNKKRRTSE